MHSQISVKPHLKKTKQWTAIGRSFLRFLIGFLQELSSTPGGEVWTLRLRQFSSCADSQSGNRPGSIIWQQMSKSLWSLHTTGACHSLLLKPCCVWECRGLWGCKKHRPSKSKEGRTKQRHRNKRCWRYFCNQRTHVRSLLRGVSVLAVCWHV